MVPLLLRECSRGRFRVWAVDGSSLMEEEEEEGVVATEVWSG
jgi:hypothetical protein